MKCKRIMRPVFLSLILFCVVCIPPIAMAKSGAGMNHYIDGTEKYEAGHYKSALTLLGKAIELESGNLDYQYYYAMTYSALGHFKEAESIYKAILKVDPKNYSNVYFDLAALYRKNNHYNKARETISKAERRHPKNPRLFFEKGIISKKMKDYTTAEKSFNKALELDPTLSQNVSYNLGLVYFDNNQYDKARRMFVMVIQEKPGSPLAEYAQRAIESMNYRMKTDKPWSVYAYIGHSYDDNLSEDPAEPSGGNKKKSDDSIGQYQVLFLKGGYRLINSGKFQMAAGYQITGITFTESDYEDSLENSPFLYMNYNANPCFLRFHYQLSQLTVNSKERQLGHTIRPSMVISEPRNMKSVISLMYKTKDYDPDSFGNETEIEDIDIWEAGFTQYFGFPNLKITPRFGIKYGDEDSKADVDTFTFIESMIGMRAILPLNLTWDLSLTDIRADYASLDYDGDGTKEKREDTGYRIETFMQKRINKTLSTKLYYGYTHNKSNVVYSSEDPYKYDKNHVRLSFSMNL